MSGDHNQHQADQCEHLWRYIGSKRQAVWQCPYCESLRFVEPPAKKWVGLTVDEILATKFAARYIDTEFVTTTRNDLIQFAREIETILREKNG